MNTNQPLIPFLLQDWWSRDEACMIFTGYVWKGDGKLTIIANGEVIADFREGPRGRWDEIPNDKYIDICKVWDGTDHPRDTGIYRVQLPHGAWNKYYCIHWALTKKPFIVLHWLDWAYEQELLNKQDHQRMLDILEKKVLAVDTGKEPGEDELKNRVRLIAILKDMLLDPKVGKHGVFQNQESVANYIQANFDDKYPNKKLTAKGVQDVFALGNKALKDTE